MNDEYLRLPWFKIENSDNVEIIDTLRELLSEDDIPTCSDHTFENICAEYRFIPFEIITPIAIRFLPKEFQQGARDGWDDVWEHEVTELVPAESDVLWAIVNGEYGILARTRILEEAGCLLKTSKKHINDPPHP